MKLSKEEFELVVRYTPLVSIDFVIKIIRTNVCLDYERMPQLLD